MSSRITELRTDIAVFKALQKEILLGDYVYKVNPNDPVGAYEYVRENFDHFLQLEDKKKRVNYCMLNGKLAENYHELATQYNVEGQNRHAAIHYLNAFMRGHAGPLDKILHSSFQTGSCQVVDNKEISLSSAICYLMGLGRQQNIFKARYILKSLAVNNKRYAQLLLGLLYENGVGVSKNPSKADSLYHKSQLNVALYHLAQLHATGCGTWRSNIIATFYMKKACKSALPQALASMSERYRKGLGMLLSHPKKADHYKHLANVQALDYQPPVTNSYGFFQQMANNQQELHKEPVTRTFTH